MRSSPSQSRWYKKYNGMVQPQKTAQPTKTSRIIDIYLSNPHDSRREIAKKAESSYSLTRNIISKFNKNRSTFRGSPESPVQVHSGWNEWDGTCRHIDYEKIPEAFINNQNGQKCHSTLDFAITIYKNSSVRVFAYSSRWQEKLSAFLLRFWDKQFVDMFFNYLVNKADQSHICFESPVPLPDMQLRMKGIGTLKTCRTPFQTKGKPQTWEYELDPQFYRDMRAVKQQLALHSRMLNDYGQSMQVFAVGMREHMALIKQMQDATSAFQNGLAALQKVVDQLAKAIGDDRVNDNSPK